jgi:hypothetical protein
LASWQAAIVTKEFFFGCSRRLFYALLRLGPPLPRAPVTTPDSADAAKSFAPTMFSRDGQRFLMIKDEAGTGETVISASMVVVVN